MVKRFLQARIDSLPEGPSVQQRTKGQSLVWGQVTDEKGNSATARLKGPEGYTLTALSAMNIVEKVLNGRAPIGFQTPSMAYGPDLILEIKGVIREDVSIRKNIKVQ